MTTYIGENQWAPNDVVEFSLLQWWRREHFQYQWRFLLPDVEIVSVQHFDTSQEAWDAGHRYAEQKRLNMEHPKRLKLRWITAKDEYNHGRESKGKP